jgi:hypothetical protein
MATPPLARSDLSPSERQALHHWLAEFERTWEKGRLASAVRLLPPPGTPLRSVALIELIQIDIRRNWEAGVPLTVESYLRSYPELGVRDAAPAELVEAEYEARRRTGAANPWAELAVRFPGGRPRRPGSLLP